MNQTDPFTSRFYHEIWNHLSPDEYHEAHSLLRDRWIKYNQPFSMINDADILDHGCGSARYSYALSKLGAKTVHGIDHIEPPIPDEITIPNFQFSQMNVLDLSFPDDHFDGVFSNGVLHHTRDWRAGIAEAGRVVKPGGWLWLMVLREHDSWRQADIVREQVDDRAAEAFIQCLRRRGVRPGHIFWLTDLFFVPHREYCHEPEVVEELQTNGFEDIEVLTGEDSTMIRLVAKYKR